MPGLFDITKDLCELMSPNSTTIFFFRNVINHFYKDQLDQIEQLFRQCPVDVSILKVMLILFLKK
jgi:hypothetical protein